MKKITLLWGLPASGKTTYAQEQFGPQKKLVNVDSMMRHYSGVTLFKKVAEDATYGHYQHVIIDSLLTTNKKAKELIDTIRKETKQELTFDIVWWKEDREACLWNDRGRRRLTSAPTIEKMVFEKPDPAILKDITLTHKKVVRKPSWKVWAQENDLGSEKTLDSQSWSLGGSAGSCWGDEKSKVYPDTPPTSFSDLDNVLEKVCPQISFLQYKKIHKECVTTKTEGESDYYGGYVEYAKFVCDIEKLYSILVELELVEEIN